MKGSILQNEIYCSKQGELVHFGLPFIGKGGRRDLQVYYDLVKTGKSDLELCDHDFGTFARTLKATDRVRLAIKPPRRTTARKVVLLVGATGAGKSRRAHDMFPDLFKVPYSKNLWIDGYQREPQVLFEEFTGQYPLVGTLQLFDPWQTQRFELKGSFQWFTPDTIIVTSNCHPKDWYDYSKRSEQEYALRRRFSQVIWYVTKSIIREYNTEKEIEHYWPLSSDKQARPVPVLNPIEQARKDGTLCHQCYVVPCACLLPQPPEALHDFSEEDREVQVVDDLCIACGHNYLYCNC